jgi:hypothetical protein
MLFLTNKNHEYDLSYQSSITTYRVLNETHRKEFQPDSGTWISTTLPVQGTIPIGYFLAFTITLDASELECGDYYADLEIRWSNPGFGTGLIPVTLHVVDTIVNLEEQSINDLHIYPNPFTYYTTIKFSGAFQIRKIDIVDIFGRIVRTIDNIHSNSVTIHRENLPGGIYFIRIHSDETDETYVRRVIIR